MGYCVKLPHGLSNRIFQSQMFAPLSCGMLTNDHVVVDCPGCRKPPLLPQTTLRHSYPNYIHARFLNAQRVLHNV